MEHLFVILAYGESAYLEDCIKSVVSQHGHPKILIATSTPNTYIKTLAQKYHLDIKVNKKAAGIAADFDFALSCAASTTNLVTIAHQDDIYEPGYSRAVQEAFNKHPDSSIVFTDYYELRNNQKVFTNTNLKIKHLLLLSLKITHGHTRFIKRLTLRFGDPICCPAVSFNTQKVQAPLFQSHFKCNVDWHAWETLSKRPGSFTFINQKLMGHRVHNDSTTTEIIKSNLRTKEDEEILRRFWPSPIAHFIAKIYANSEKSNQTKL